MILQLLVSQTIHSSPIRRIVCEEHRCGKTLLWECGDCGHAIVSWKYEGGSMKKMKKAVQNEADDTQNWQKVGWWQQKLDDDDDLLHTQYCIISLLQIILKKNRQCI